MFAPSLSPGSKTTHWFWKFTQTGLLTFLLVVLLVAYPSLYLAHYYLAEIKVSTPQEIYHNAWIAVRDNIHDQDRIANWERWEHKYDSKIQTDEDAIQYAQIMVASLKDPYSFVLDAATTRASYDAAKGKPEGSDDKSKSHVNDPPKSASTTGTSTASTAAQAANQVVFTKVLAGNIGYLRIDSFIQLDTHEQVYRGLLALKDCSSLIVDVRGNPGGLIHPAFLAATMFLDEGLLAIEHVHLPASGYLTYECRLTSYALLITSNHLAVPLPRYSNLSGKRPVVLLVDGNTASAAELFTGALKDNGRVTIVGSKSFGKGIGQTYVPIGNGARLRITNFRSYTPSGKWLGDGAVLVANGVDPDIAVRGHFNKSLSEQLDPQLDAAVKFLHP